MCKAAIGIGPCRGLVCRTGEIQPMGSYARLSQEEFRSRPEEAWSEQLWAPVLAVEDKLDATRPRNDGLGLAGWTVGTRNLPAKPAPTESISPVAEPSSVGWSPCSRPQGSRNAGFSVEQLLDDVRRAVEWNPEATRAAVSQLVTFLTPPAAIEPAGAQGGLAPWHKRKVDRYLRENLDQPVRLEAVAEQVALSVSYFSRAFKKSFGTTPHMHIVRLRLELAQKLMLTTEEPLSQIALACGLADQAHLSKLFRRVVGETPSSWRRRNVTDAQVQVRSRRSTSGQIALPVTGATGATGSRGIAASP
jgi:AraC family transcriptional regulator